MRTAPPWARRAGAAIDVIYDVASRLSGISENDMAELGGGYGRRPFRRFTYSLARELHMTRQQLLANATSLELTEWMSYFQLESIEQERSKDKAEIQQQNSRRRGRRR